MNLRLHFPLGACLKTSSRIQSERGERSRADTVTRAIGTQTYLDSHRLFSHGEAEVSSTKVHMTWE